MRSLMSIPLGKPLIAFWLALAASCAGWAQSEGFTPVAHEVRLTDPLPINAVLRIRSDVSTTRAGSESYLNDKNDDWAKGGVTVLARRNTTLRAKSVLFMRMSERPDQIQFTVQSDGNGNLIEAIFVEKRDLRTVGDLRNCCLQFFELVLMEDPYGYLPDAAAVDLLTSKITKAIAADKLRDELISFYFLEKRTKDLPEIAQYYYAEALRKAGRKEEAKERAAAYVKRFGQAGKYYRQTIELLTQL